MKKIIFFLVYLTVNSFSSVDCCTPFGKVWDYNVGRTYDVPIAPDLILRQTIDEDCKVHDPIMPEEYVAPTCISEGFAIESSSWRRESVYSNDPCGVYASVEVNNVWILATVYESACKCTTPDLPLDPPEIDTTKWVFQELSNSCATSPENQTFHTDVCLESDGIHSLIQSERNDCCTVRTCYVPRSPLCEEPYELHENYKTIEECQDLALDLSANNNVQMDYITNPDTSLSSCCIALTEKEDENVTEDSEDDGTDSDGTDTDNTTDSDGTDTDNTTDSDGTDTDNTTNDGTNTDSSSSVDTTEVEKILNDIKSDLSDFSDVNHEDLGEVRESIEDASNLNHSDLADINKSINSLRELSEPDKNERDDISDSLDGVIEDAKNFNKTMTGYLADVAGAWSTVGTPFTSSGGNDFCFEIWGRRVCLDLSFLANTKPYFDILFAMILAFLNFKVYTRIVGFLLFIGL